MFSELLIKNSLELDIQRLSKGNYKFGAKKIAAKITNEKLLIRVGGEYMSAEKFIEKYGKTEIKE